MGGPHIFGFTGTLRKAKATPVRSTPQTSPESRTRSSGNDAAYQCQNQKYSQGGTVRDHGLESTSASGTATECRTLVVARDEELGHWYTVSKKASSQLLGNQNYEYSYESGSRVDQTAQSLRGHGSSSTLHSFYDPQQIPLAVSQQTSNSSARDFALRKGCPPVVPIDKPVSRLSHHQKTVDAGKSNSTKKTSPIRVDISMLFPKPSARHDHLISPQVAKGPTEQEPSQSVMPPAVPLGPRTRQNHRSNIPNANKAPLRLRSIEDLAPAPDVPDYSKMNTRKPKSGVKHWFDNFEDEDLELINRHETVGICGLTKSERGIQPRINTVPGELEAKEHKPNRVSVHNKSCEPKARGIPLPHLQMPSAADPRAVSPARELRLALQHWEFRSKHNRTTPAKAKATHLRKDRNNPFNKVDLHKDSLLWLSSSDDESEADDSLHSDISTTIPGIRDSLVVAPSDGSDVEFGFAHAIETKRPRLEKESLQRTSQSRSSRSKDSPLKTVDIPDRQSSKMFSFLGDQPRPLSNTPKGAFGTGPVTATSSELVDNYLHDSSTASQWHDCATRLMGVTAQEESLLEAMRSKRATMRQSILTETLRKASEGEQGKRTIPPLRPQTSGCGGTSASFLRLSQDSVPTLSAFRHHRRSISAGEVLEFNGLEPRDSCSTDPLASHRGSLVNSSLPSTSSQDSPPTPTLDSPPDTSARRVSSSTKRYSTLSTDYQRHNRVRTGSSAVIVLDNLDDESTAPFKQDDLPIWAFNGWPDRPGIAVAH